MFTKKKIIIGLIFIAAVSGLYYYFGRSTGEVIQTETVKLGDVVETVSVTGELVPTEYADLAFQGVGVVDQVAVKEGDTVVLGDRIASLDQSVLGSQWKESRIALSIVEQSELEARSRRNTQDKGWNSLRPEERATIKLETEQARESVRTLEAQMKENAIYAPFDGQVTKLDLRIGETATLGKIVGRIAKSGDFVIEARVPESDIAKVMIGMRSKVTFDAFRSDEVFDAEVVEIDPASTVVQDVVSYTVKFRLGNTDSRLKEGMTANIDIETAKQERVLTVPFRALTKEGGKMYAEVKQGDGTFLKTEVMTGLEGDDGTIEIKSGLKSGDAVTLGTTQKK